MSKMRASRSFVGLVGVIVALIASLCGVVGEDALAVSPQPYSAYLPIVVGRQASPTPTPPLCDGYVQALTNPGFDGTYYPWSFRGNPVSPLECLAPMDCAIWLAGYNGAAESIWQYAEVPLWAETAAIYFDWAMLSEEGILNAYDSITISAMAFSGGLPYTIAKATIDNQAPRDDWYWSKVTIPNIALYRGQVISVQAFASTDSAYPTGWYIDNVELYFACGSVVAGEEETGRTEECADRAVRPRPLEH